MRPRLVIHPLLIWIVMEEGSVEPDRAPLERPSEVEESSTPSATTGFFTSTLDREVMTAVQGKSGTASDTMPARVTTRSLLNSHCLACGLRKNGPHEVNHLRKLALHDQGALVSPRQVIR